MPLKTGTYSVGPDNGTLLIRTGREGAAARMGHDLVIAATRWQASITLDVDDLSGSRVTASVDARSLEVREGNGGVKPLSPKDCADIEKTVREKVFQAGTHPEIAFVSTGITGTTAAAAISGTLTIAGAARPAVLRVTTDDRGRVTGTMTVVQTEFGIKPYSALLGSLKVKDTVEVSVEIQLPRD